MTDLEIIMAKTLSARQVFEVLSGGFGWSFLLLIAAIAVTSTVKQQLYGNQLVSVKNALGFSIATFVILILAALLALVWTNGDRNTLFATGNLISTFLYICSGSAVSSWAYGAWIGRVERDQMRNLDVPVALLALVILTASLWNAI